MDLHEYQAKERFRAAGIPVPPGEVATTPAEAEKIAKKYGGAVVVKAQVHSGGRGKAGGVKLAKSAEEARSTPRRSSGWTSRASRSGRCS
jgi:succinyl-CoA synthetase beta subunit